MEADASSSQPSDQFDSDHHPDFSPVGSPDDFPDSHFPPPPPHQHPPLSADDLRQRIIKQVEYYLSDENLPTDKFLMKFITRNGGFVPIGVIASFRKMKRLTKDVSVIVAALRESSLLAVSSSGKTVKRVHPLPTTEVRDPQLCTVLVENLPEDHSVENLRRIFGEVGKVAHISVRDPHSVKEAKKCNYADKLLNNKLHAVVEYDTTEAAEKAVESLNNEHDWRNGLRVKLLKTMNKPGQKKKVWRDSDPEKNHLVQASDQAAHDDNYQFSDHQDDSHDEEVREHLPNQRNGEHMAKEKNGHPVRNHGHGRRRGTNGYVRGPLNPNHAFEPSKPPPGPKMPDGTKGFTMGRGRPLVVNES